MQENQQPSNANQAVNDGQPACGDTTRKAAPTEPPRVYQTGSAWGNACYFLNYEKRKVSGHKPRPPHVGDLLESPMQSGRIGVFRFIEVERMRDPPDMFFATVADVGFKDELDAARAALSATGEQQP